MKVWHNSIEYHIFDSVEINFGHAGIVTEVNWVGESESIQYDHPESKRVGLIKIYLGRSFPELRKSYCKYMY